ncbi:hypothetical protein C6P40_004120 [Pichia californica]|uniref:RING-type domain-containing protein n=1 Tax=Pichia californica TaxID=460514 RepID=A0A9P7BD23_9ASCO|nr:hypothetical protein C6P42_003817 [[Candida] californica]KAG0686431.1 hypothetical protein C6P40_004120 [[Candida] californica]
MVSTNNSKKNQRFAVLQHKSSGGSTYTSSSESSEEDTYLNHDHNLDGVDENEEICLICAENIKIVSLSPCNHKVCHMCSFRNVALYKKNQCLVCRTEVPHFIFTENLVFDKFDEISENQLIKQFKGDHNIRFTSEYAKDETLKLLEYTCPIKSCSFHGRKFSNFKEVNNHVKDVHDKYYCELCAKFKKAFISELKLYGRKQLHNHQSKGDSIGFKGHPECKFCTNKRFYSDDELYVHMRDHHERCHICQQIDPNNPQYFRNYDHLAQHFKSAHYICTIPSCLEQKFVVFQDEFDLQTHMAKDHPSLCGGGNILLSTNTFNTQLYTVPNNKKKSKSQTTNSNQDNYELKKKRLEERARHYLNYSQRDFDTFLAANIEYSCGSMSAQEIVNKYHEIFKKSKDVDYDLLIYELSGLFPAKSDLRKDLEAINKPQLEVREMKEKFPSLPGTTNSMHQSFWNGNENHRSSSKLNLSNSRSMNSSNMPALPVDNSPLFPSLPKTSSWSEPVKVINKSSSNLKTRGISSNTPINGFAIPGYNPISTSSKSKAKNPWNSTKSVSSVNPNVSSTNAFPALPSISSSSSNKITIAKPTPKQVISQPVDTSLFPSLPNEPKKKVIPRVNPVSNSAGVWGSSSKGNNGNNSSASDAFDLDILGSSLKTVKGKKGKKVVYHIGL